jgi:hypothetical protein
LVDRAFERKNSTICDLTIFLCLWFCFFCSSVEEDSEETEEEELEDQHAIAIAIKAIVLANRLAVGAEQELAACKRAYQHEQSRARQMKIRQQKIDSSKIVWRINENVCGAGLRN